MDIANNTEVILNAHINVQIPQVLFYLNEVSSSSVFLESYFIVAKTTFSQ